MPIDKNIGSRFGRLVVLELVEKVNYMKKYKCVCDCGNIRICYLNNLKSGKTVSCGCYRKKVSAETLFVHGDRHTRLYSIWTNMKTRCYNKNSTGYKNYGGRGIRVCDEWRNDFTAFKKWAYENDYNDSLTIERIDTEGNYEPNNCKWIERKYQSRNRRSARLVTIKGETKTLKEWCDHLKINYKSVHSTVRRGSSEIEAIKYHLDMLIELEEQHG